MRWLKRPGLAKLAASLSLLGSLAWVASLSFEPQSVPVELKVPNAAEIILATSFLFANRTHFQDGLCLARRLLSREGAFKKEDVTFVTQTSTRHIKDLGLLSERWDGPISLVVFVFNGEQLTLATKLLYLLRHCSAQIRDKVNVGIFFYPNEEWTDGCRPKESSLGADLPCFDCHECLTDLSSLPALQEDPDWYPVNLARNLAKDDVSSDWELIADVELVPSPGLVPKIRHVLEDAHPEGLEAWVVPVFELDKGESRLPQSHEELRGLVSENRAVAFHRKRAYECHRIPFPDQWLAATQSTAKVLASVRWQRPCWEPVYVARHSTPRHHESFKGYIKNKVQQVYGMCRHNYTFHVLSSVFLLHRGISKLTGKEVERIGKYIGRNNHNFRLYQKELDAQEDENPTLAATKEYCDANIKDRDGGSKPCPPRYKGRGPCAN